MINVIIADDMKEYRDHFRMLLANERDITVLALASSEGGGYKKKSSRAAADVILMDIQMDSDRSGNQCHTGNS